MLARARLCGASLTKVRLIVSQARLERGRTRRGASVIAPPPDSGSRTRNSPAYSFRLVQILLPAPAQFRGQIETNLIRLRSEIGFE
jgi:hypothetical protein